MIDYMFYISKISQMKFGLTFLLIISSTITRSQDIVNNYSESSGVSKYATYISDASRTRDLSYTQVVDVVNYLAGFENPPFVVGDFIDNSANLSVKNGKSVYKTINLADNIINGIPIKLIKMSVAHHYGNDYFNIHDATDIAAFQNELSASAIHNVDARMLLFLYKFTSWLQVTWGPANNCEIVELHTAGIGQGGTNPLDCHNTGRAFDFSGIVVKDQNGERVIRVYNDWGNKHPEKFVDGQITYRLEESDGLPYYFFRDAYNWSLFQCSILPGHQDNELSDEEIAARYMDSGVPLKGGMVLHPDTPEGGVRAAHVNHFHFQFGPTGYEAPGN